MQLYQNLKYKRNNKTNPRVNHLNFFLCEVSFMASQERRQKIQTGMEKSKRPLLYTNYETETFEMT